MPDNDKHIGKGNDQEVSLKVLLLNFNAFLFYSLKKWRLVLTFVIIGALLGLGVALFKRTQYTASLSFVLEEQSGGGSMGAAASIAAQFGINLGAMGQSAGFFQDDNIIEFLKSRSMIDETLLSMAIINGKSERLVDRYVDFKGLRKKWKSNNRIAGIQFQDTTGIYLQDSLMAMFYKTITKDHLNVRKPDKRLNIIEVSLESPDELFSKVFVEKLIANASDFYIRTRTKRAQENLDVLTFQVDSVRQELNSAIRGVAAATDANPNPNRAFQSLRVASQLRTVDVQANTEILKELVANQELAKITLRNEKPIIQTLDQPILPLKNDKIGKAKGIILGGFLGGVFIGLGLLGKFLYRRIMEA
ncbi:lipopolysaccharide biosynthesis protein [Parapedobacter lycopersici]|uniref:lipopolysaccharide biosynthesis protein n=1 Tax=Parapedobacter lycopersici TaxID=1864939 RepID=UPI00333FDF33